MVRRPFLAMAFALCVIRRDPSGMGRHHRARAVGKPKRRASRAAAADYAKLKSTKVEIVQAPYNNVFEPQPMPARPSPAPSTSC